MRTGTTTVDEREDRFRRNGGSGKTTLSSLFVRHLAAARLPVVAIDADINQHLGSALGPAEGEAAAIPGLGAPLPEIKQYLRGTNPPIASADSVIRTTPPGTGSRPWSVVEDNPVFAACARVVPLDVGEVRLMVTRPFAESHLGVACHHSKIGALSEPTHRDHSQ